MLASNKLPPPPPSQILAKTNYDMSTHAAESAGWMNVLFAQVSFLFLYAECRGDKLTGIGDAGIPK
jgi:hypothetical protein